MASSFGSIDRLPSGRYRARFVGPDRKRHSAPVTFQRKTQARSWLTTQHAKIIEATWTPPVVRQPKAVPTLGEYAKQWLAQRELKPRTRHLYSSLLDTHVLPAFGHRLLDQITVADVKGWYGGLDKNTPTARAHAYNVLRTVMGSAVSDELAQANPCALRGAGNPKRATTIRPASPAEINAIAENMPEHLRLLILLCGWCALRFGEATELRRKDVDLAQEVIRIRRGVVHVGGQFVVGTPKSAAGVRDVAIPPHLLDTIQQHLGRFVGEGPDDLLFCNTNGGHLSRSTLGWYFYPARKAAGREDLRLHDLRHSGAVIAALIGATLKELMDRLGHSNPAMALNYQHVAQGRQSEIAALMSKLNDTTD